jgi:hypothetical protein
MSNMSYCRFRNTLNDLRDCYYNMDEKLEGDELSARDMMISLCKQIVAEYGEVEEDNEESED